MNKITPDLIFSYWIYAWFIIYYIIITVSITKTNIIIQNANPFIILYIALIENILSLFYLFFSTYDLSISFVYLLMLLLLKVLPIYLLTSVKAPINIFSNIVITILIVLIYFLYVEVINSISVIKLYKNIMNSIIMKKNNTPFFHIYSKLSSCIQYLLKKKSLDYLN